MSASIVNFLVPSGDVEDPFDIEQRVFDYRIGSDAQAIFEATFGKIRDLFNNYSSGTADLTTINAYIKGLDNWSKMKTGAEPAGTPIADVPYYHSSSDTATNVTPSTTMNSGMASALDKVIRIMRSAGWDPTLGTAPSTSVMQDAMTKIQAGLGTVYPLNTWFDQGVAAAKNAFLVAATGQTADTSGTSLQELLMVEYVSNGNKILYDQMEGLSEAIDSNQQALAYLNSLQNLMNQKTPEQFVMALGNLSSATLTNANYTTFEQESFNKTLETTAKFTENTITSYLAQLQNLSAPQLEILRSSGLDSLLESEISGWGNTYAANVTTMLNTVLNTVGIGTNSLEKYAFWYKDPYVGPLLIPEFAHLSTDYVTNYQDLLLAKSNVESAITTYQNARAASGAVSAAYWNSLSSLHTALANFKTASITLQDGLFSQTDPSHNLNELLTKYATDYRINDQNYNLLGIKTQLQTYDLSGSLTTWTNYISFMTDQADRTSYSAFTGGNNYDDVKAVLSQLATPMNTLSQSLASLTSTMTTTNSKLSSINTLISSLNPSYFTTAFTQSTFTTKYTALTSAATNLTSKIEAYNSAKESIGSSTLRTACNDLATAFATYQTEYSSFFNGDNGFDTFTKSMISKALFDADQSSATIAINLLTTYYGYNPVLGTDPAQDLSTFLNLPGFKDNLTTTRDMLVNTHDLLNAPDFPSSYFAPPGTSLTFSLSAFNTTYTTFLNSLDELKTAITNYQNVESQTGSSAYIEAQSNLWTKLLSYKTNKYNLFYQDAFDFGTFMSYLESYLIAGEYNGDGIPHDQNKIDKGLAVKAACGFSGWLDTWVLYNKAQISLTIPQLQTFLSTVPPENSLDSAWGNLIMAVGTAGKTSTYFSLIDFYAVDDLINTYGQKLSLLAYCVEINSISESQLPGLAEFSTAFNDLFYTQTNSLSKIMPQIITLSASETNSSILEALNAFKQTYYTSGIVIPATPTWTSALPTKLESVVPDQTTVASLLNLLQSAGYDPTKTYTDTDITGSAAAAFLDVSTTTKSLSIELQRIKDNLNHIKEQIQLNTGTSALVTSLETVRSDFDKHSTIADWVKDFDSSQQGNYQTNLNNAVVASQALNDAKREELQRTMFIFEEFYKSAMALLTRLTQIIEKMATAMSR